ncbi:MAG: beta-N-acetylhexosaminidase, partial [Verrucomicrobiae bacterium]|nr:beta-N-acetylhexosaminidase [Verrucomicrobiae bacterium]
DSIRLVRERLAGGSEAYTLQIDRDKIEIGAGDEVGWFYGLCTLRQIATQCSGMLLMCHIEDFPDFQKRGMMLDISRNKVPKLETLFFLIEQFASWKINELQLYIEHTFAYEGHDTVWKDASPLTKEDIQTLDAFCQERFIELVPNLNCFGHMSRWLIHDAYRPLAEQPEGGDTDFGYRKVPQGLCAIDPGSITLAKDLIRQMTSCFQSGQVNVGCDETIDLGYGRSKPDVERRGRGRVYLDFLKKIHAICAAENKRMQFWADILLKYPELIAEIPKGCVVLDWGYEADHPFKKETRRLRNANTDFYVCPGTSSWNSLGGRTENMIQNISSAAHHGRKQKALGMMTTDWGDNGHWQPLVSSFSGFVLGASKAWNEAHSPPLHECLDVHVFRQHGLGDLLLATGRLDESLGIKLHNKSILFVLLQSEAEEIKKLPGLKPGKLKQVLSATDKLIIQLEAISPETTATQLFISELLWVLKMLTLAGLRGIAILTGKPDPEIARLEQSLRDEHASLWQLRNRPGGYSESRDLFAVLLQD